MELTQSEKDLFLLRLKEITEANLSKDHFGVSDLAREMGMSRSNLHRRFKLITNTSISRYVKDLRLEESSALLKETSLTVSEIAYKTGFQSVSYFSKSFRDHYGYSPSDFRHQTASNENHKKHNNKNLSFIFRTSRRGLIWIAVILVLITAATYWAFTQLPFGGNGNKKAKTIAVLPFIDDSPTKENAYISNGLMEAILTKLAMVQDINVISRTSVESYRDTDKSAVEIGKELHVGYILEGGLQTINGKTVIRLQLIDAEHDKHLWAMPFKREITLENIFSIQEEVALKVANELEVVLSSNDRRQLRSVPTASIDAYDFFLIGKDFLNTQLYSIDSREKERALAYAKQYFEKALKLDSTYADAYSQLGSIYIIYLFHSESANSWDKANAYLDSGLLMLDKALYYDPENTEALASKAAYFELKGRHDEANPIYESIAENGYLTFEFGVSRYNSIHDYYNAINNYFRYIQTKPGDVLIPPYLLRMMIVVFRKAGFPDLEKQLIDQLLSFNNDTLEYLNSMVMHENWQGNYQAALNYGMKITRLDPSDSFSYLVAAVNSTYLKDYKQALILAKQFDSLNIQMHKEFQPSGAAGFIYLKNGEMNKAETHLREIIPRWQDQIKNNTHTAQTFYYLHELAGVYLDLGEKEEAMEYLEKMKDLVTIDRVQITILKNWPSFDSLRNDPEFQEIIQVLNTKYQEQHLRIEELLRREGIRGLRSS